MGEQVKRSGKRAEPWVVSVLQSKGGSDALTLSNMVTVTDSGAVEQAVVRNKQDQALRHGQIVVFER